MAAVAEEARLRGWIQASLAAAIQCGNYSEHERLDWCQMRQAAIGVHAVVRLVTEMALNGPPDFNGIDAISAVAMGIPGRGHGPIDAGFHLDSLFNLRERVAMVDYFDGLFQLAFELFMAAKLLRDNDLQGGKQTCQLLEDFLLTQILPTGLIRAAGRPDHPME